MRGRRPILLLVQTLPAALLLAASPGRAEDGYRLWLRYGSVEAPLRPLAWYEAIRSPSAPGQ